MNSGLVNLIDAVATIDGTIKVKQLSAEKIASLADVIVGISLNRLGAEVHHRFGGTTFRPAPGKKSVVIDTGFPAFDFEIKVIMVLMGHTGTLEGGHPYKWATIVPRVRMLVKVARFMGRRGINSFRDFATIPTIKLRTWLVSFLNGKKAEGGLNAGAKTSLYKPAREGLMLLHEFGLVTTLEYRTLIDELTLAAIDRHSAEKRLSHPIIPTAVMKQLISEAVTYINNAELVFPELERVFRLTHAGIQSSNSAEMRNAITASARKAGNKLTKLLKHHFVDLQRHTYCLVLAFTGMRDGEAAALRTGCGGKRKEDGEDIYWLSSLLSKTDDQEITLDWVANDLAYRAVTLLSRVNDLYYERATLILKHYQDRMSPGHTNKIKEGLAARRLFGIRMTARTMNFIRNTKNSERAKTMNFSRYQIPLRAADIAQLEEMECNYRSVAENTGERGEPYLPGDLFNFTAHQFRHTFAWFIIANRLGISNINLNISAGR